ncbi:hypothetical protein Tsubulata_039505 [Turnera subulata]|uniref:Cystatin domain-containing protein n=1 Tax=Turnera subulata TaxID=218843 RepID=A0A9Q0GDL4_9ROSI|nr:hypothetical protein Tsubulata_039505 [Turnera subulata]
MERHCLLLCLLFLAAAGATAQSWWLDPKMEEMSKFAVATHNQQKKTALEFESVYDVRRQMVRGNYVYDIYLTAKEGGVGSDLDFVASVYGLISHATYKCKLQKRPNEGKELQEYDSYGPWMRAKELYGKRYSGLKSFAKVPFTCPSGTSEPQSLQDTVNLEVQVNVPDAQECRTPATFLRKRKAGPDLPISPIHESSRKHHSDLMQTVAEIVEDLDKNIHVQASASKPSWKRLARATKVGYRTSANDWGQAYETGECTSDGMDVVVPIPFGDSREPAAPPAGDLPGYLANVFYIFISLAHDSAVDCEDRVLSRGHDSCKLPNSSEGRGNLGSWADIFALGKGNAAYMNRSSARAKHTTADWLGDTSRKQCLTVELRSSRNVAASAKSDQAGWSALRSVGPVLLRGRGHKGGGEDGGGGLSGAPPTHLSLLPHQSLPWRSIAQSCRSPPPPPSRRPARDHLLQCRCSRTSPSPDEYDATEIGAGLAAAVEGQSTDHDRAQRPIRLPPSPLRGYVGPTELIGSVLLPILVVWVGDGYRILWMTV